MNVSDALQLEELQKAVVLAGNGGLNRQIKAAEVMEVPDISGWLTEGILIISTFYSVKDLPEAQIKMFKNLIQVNGAGLIIKVGRYVKELPQEMYHLANEHNMPIISLPVDVSFVNILTALFEKIYEEKKAYQHEHFQMMDKLLNNKFHNFQEFLIHLSSITGENVYYEDYKDRLLAYANKKVDKRRKSFKLLSLPAISKIEDRLVIPIEDANGCFGSLHILYGQSPLLVGVLESFLTSINEQAKLLLLKDQFEFHKQHQRENQFLHKLLLENRIIDDEVMKSYLKSERSDTSYGLFAIEISKFPLELLSPQEKDMVTVNFAYNKLNEIVESMLGKTILYNDHRYLYGLYVCQDGEKREHLFGKLRKITEMISAEFECKVHIGVSLSRGHLEEMDKAMDEVKVILQSSIDSNQEETVLAYEQLGINKILLKLKNDEDIKELIKMKLDAIRFDEGEKHDELLQTLEVFLLENGNHSKASEKLFIHRRTLKYRLDKIEAILNINLDDSETRFLLYFLLKMRGILLA
ncbi:PucR family transcriptional regulator ligand-binding domain-containing protein [Alkalihalobacillus sp. TS-13]|uniref:PucR family transcriptional regulator n=1 Tax=Alkalihalobacillus sp. TS-13 TaxID=2842455 RepID=UPI001C88BF73|nr:PucR family transcriptional regulator ligand-binding domain-containing protein [Alkalihalobacillus sp. TS-13]